MHALFNWQSPVTWQTLAIAICLGTIAMIGCKKKEPEPVTPPVPATDYVTESNSEPELQEDKP